ncbi:ral guanine nucleotide dissociation stimulator-like [Choloepus didactylus]|uniref:ral guanine nucleotide dissociation stimulator-like n=1 Tax=Choloepus didactylus TaxID=27675 RepID=UPI00189D4E67|nr:ral guanine nucleotide dissociation stimulator-like [Choloepus didactylus]
MTPMQVGEQVMPRIQHLQAESKETHCQPLQQLGACFGDVEQLSEAKCPQEPSAEPSTSGNTESGAWLQSGPDLSSGDTATSFPGHVADASKPDLEIGMALVSEFPDGQEKQVGESTFPSSPESPGVTSTSSGTTSSSAHPVPRAPLRTQIPFEFLPIYNKMVDDKCIVRVRVDMDNGNVYKSMMMSRVGSCAWGPLTRSDSGCGITDMFPPCPPGAHKLAGWEGQRHKQIPKEHRRVLSGSQG